MKKLRRAAALARLLNRQRAYPIKRVQVQTPSNPTLKTVAYDG